MLNNITIMGRLVADPVLRNTNGGNPFATFTIAVDRDFDRRETDFFDCIAFAKTGEFVSKYWARGRSILIRGHIQTNKWTDRAGNKRTDVKIITDNVYFCDSPKIVGDDSTETDDDVPF